LPLPVIVAPLLLLPPPLPPQPASTVRAATMKIAHTADMIFLFILPPYLQENPWLEYRTLQGLFA
jgi:hypothetical protein